MWSSSVNSGECGLEHKIENWPAAADRETQEEATKDICRRAPEERRGSPLPPAAGSEKSVARLVGAKIDMMDEEDWVPPENYIRARRFPARDVEPLL
jgi:hypothetical protein